MTRPQALAVLLGVLAVGALLAWWRLPRAEPSLSCPDGGVRGLGADGVARCGAGDPLPAGPSMALGQKFDCNAASAAELSLVEGIGPALAQELVARRDGGFHSWDEIDAVPGMGPARLSALQAVCDIQVGDAGVW